jgi:two-component system, cell cycle sensor histidine kinase and response regulator CckA
MPGGGQITVSTRLVDHLPAGGRLGRRWGTEWAVILSVTDTGSGIDPAITGRIFEPFFTTKAFGQGTGLGLSVVEGIIAQSSGDLWLDSQPGRGTTFSIALPLVGPVSAEEPEVEQSSEGGPETILLVDDETPVREVLARGLQEKGYRVLEAMDGAEGLKILGDSADEIDIVITDVAMPRISGIDLAHRALKLRPFLPFIFVSGQPKEVLPEWGSLEQDYQLLEKPFSLEMLASCVRARLDRRPRTHASDDDVNQSVYKNGTHGTREAPRTA